MDGSRRDIFQARQKLIPQSRATWYKRAVETPFRLSTSIRYIRNKNATFSHRFHTPLV